VEGGYGHGNNSGVKVVDKADGGYLLLEKGIVTAVTNSHTIRSDVDINVVEQTDKLWVTCSFGKQIVPFGKFKRLVSPF